MNNTLKNIDTLKDQLNTLHPLNSTELKRLRDEFVIESTYNSNVIEGNGATGKNGAKTGQHPVFVQKIRVPICATTQVLPSLCTYRCSYLYSRKWCERGDSNPHAESARS